MQQHGDWVSGPCDISAQLKIKEKNIDWLFFFEQELQAAVAQKEGADAERNELMQHLVEAEAKLKGGHQTVQVLGMLVFSQCPCVALPLKLAPAVERQSALLFLLLL